MGKIKINYGVPVKMLSFSKDDKQGNFTRGKLAVFYKGTTGDNRFFSDKFSNHLVKSLPYTPIVSYYDEEKEDFVGHATEQQILGIVDPCVEPTFETLEDGHTWCICDTVYYTERPDKVGELAKKIEGHSQSLELDPNTVEYKINYDEKKHFKNIEFTAGTFVGVAVLGKNQKPAFTGSAFFANCDDAKFQEKMSILKDYCEKQKNDNNENTHNGGNEMNFQEFVKLSWGEISEKVYRAVADEYSEAYVSPIDFYNGEVICNVYYQTGDRKMLKIKYSLAENGEVSLGEVTEVHIEYVKNEPTNTQDPSSDYTSQDQGVTTESGDNRADGTTTTVTNAEAQPVAQNEADPQSPSDSGEVTEMAAAQEPQGQSDSEGQSTPADNENFAEGSEQNNDQQVTTDNTTVNDNEPNEGVQSQVQQESEPSTSAFTSSEQQELDSLRREKKINLVNSYKTNLSSEEYNNFISHIDDYAHDSNELEFELLKCTQANIQKQIEFAAAKQTQENDNYVVKTSVVPFALNYSDDNTTQENEFASFIKDALKR